MFIRWKTREDWRTKYVYHRNKHTDTVYCSGKTKKSAGKSFSAVLVRSERIDGKQNRW